MISVGRRAPGGDAWADQQRLARTAAFLRPRTPGDVREHVVVRVVDEVIGALRARGEKP